MPYSYIDLDKVNILLVHEGYSVGPNASGVRRYVITVEDGAFKTVDQQNQVPGSALVYAGQVNFGTQQNPIYYTFSYQEPTDLLFSAAIAKSKNETNPFKKIPMMEVVRSYTGIQNTYFIEGGFIFANYITPIGTFFFQPFSSVSVYSNSIHLVCVGYDLSWNNGALTVDLKYSSDGFANGKGDTILHTVSAQRYPSVYSFNASGQAVLNAVTYKGETQIAEIPDVYCSEWNWSVVSINPFNSSFYNRFVGTVNNAPVSQLVPTGSGGECPAMYAGGVMLTNYSYQLCGGVAFHATTTWGGFVPLCIHTLQFTGTNNMGLSADAGFFRPIVYTDPETGMPPSDVTVGNGVEWRLVAKPADWSLLFGV